MPTIPYVTYTKVADDQNGHRLFLGSDGHLYVADRSGSTPANTDDGPLRLMPTPTRRTITGGLDGSLLVAWNVLKDDGITLSRVELTIGCAIEAAQRLGTELMINGYKLNIELD